MDFISRWIADFIFWYCLFILTVPPMSILLKLLQPIIPPKTLMDKQFDLISNSLTTILSAKKKTTMNIPLARLQANNQVWENVVIFSPADCTTCLHLGHDRINCAYPLKIVYDQAELVEDNNADLIQNGSNKGEADNCTQKMLEHNIIPTGPQVTTAFFMEQGHSSKPMDRKRKKPMTDLQQNKISTCENNRLLVSWPFTQQNQQTLKINDITISPPPPSPPLALDLFHTNNNKLLNQTLISRKRGRPFGFTNKNGLAKENSQALNLDSTRQIKKRRRAGPLFNFVDFILAPPISYPTPPTPPSPTNIPTINDYPPNLNNLSAATDLELYGYVLKRSLDHSPANSGTLSEVQEHQLIMQEAQKRVNAPDYLLEFNGPDKDKSGN